MLKHIALRVQISQCDNMPVIQIMQTRFEIDHTGYALYCMQFRISYPIIVLQQRWPCGTTAKRSHTCTFICVM